MSGSFDDLYAKAEGASPTDIDTSFLDRFRERAAERELDQEPDAGADTEALIEQQLDEPVPDAAEFEPDAGDADEALSEAGDDLEFAPEPELDSDLDEGSSLERSDEPEKDSDDAEAEQGEDLAEPEHEDSKSAERGGSGSGSENDAGAAGAAGAAGVAAAAVLPEQPADHAPAEQVLRDEGTSRDAGDDAAHEIADHDEKAASKQRQKDVSTRRKSDQRDAIQSASGTKGGSGSGSDDLLPRSGFGLPGVSSTPLVRGLPQEITGVLRERLKAAAIRELGVSEKAASTFSEQISQSGLVIGFLLAQLDVRMEADPATTAAVKLFRSQDPLLGSVALRMDDLEAREAKQAEQLAQLLKVLTEVRDTSAVLEQEVAYSIADSTENLARGGHTVDSIPLTHKSAILVRDRAREETRKQRKIEKEREGRPIR